MKNVPCHKAHTANVLQVSSPCICTQAHSQPPAWKHSRGDLYLKCLSPAYAVEWILVDGLRPSIQL